MFDTLPQETPRAQKIITSRSSKYQKEHGDSSGAVRAQQLREVYSVNGHFEDGIGSATEEDGIGSATEEDGMTIRTTSKSIQCRILGRIRRFQQMAGLAKSKSSHSSGAQLRMPRGHKKVFKVDLAGIKAARQLGQVAVKDSRQ
ncbi:hypothetical protein ABZP36_009376 [Zizania latifolia]